MQQASHAGNLVQLVPRELEAALSRGVRTPIAALRAALEDLVHSDRQGGAMAEGALRELFDLDRHVETLLEYVAPADLRPLRCSLEEIVRGSQDQLSDEHRPRVLLASERDRSFVEVDGPVLSRALTRLLAETLREAQGEVLLHAQRRTVTTCFAIVEYPCAAKPVPGIEGKWEGLEVLLAHREIVRMGGRVEVFESAGAHHRLEVHFPHAADRGGRP